ncbi:MAG TPA: response regulator [Candidatus Binatia bacterium]|nr:response regulator [Candidatus Binatia bacterium]
MVDDDDSMREAIQNLIKSVGFRAEAFASTEEFVQCDHLGEIACLILDMQLPGMSGLELQRLLAVATYEIPIIFITAQYNGGVREQALKAGAVDFLYKPFNEEALLKAVHSALNRLAKATTTAPEAPRRGPSEKASSISAISDGLS